MIHYAEVNLPPRATHRGCNESKRIGINLSEARKILVTGGAGYIGSHTCKAIAEAGMVPVTFDNFSYGHEDFVQWGPLERGDLADPARIDEVIARHKPDAVMHFAAFAYVGESIENPEIYYRNNVIGSIHLLEAMRRGGVDKIVFSSTCATYGEPRSLPLGEDHPQNPINPYGTTKMIIERALAEFGHAYGMRNVTLRYFNAAGADPECRIGEDHNPEAHLVPLVLDVALGRRKDIAIFGGDYDTPDGTCVRDYIHVDDIASAHILALGHLDAGHSSASFNLGNGHGYSVREVAELAAKVTGKPIATRMTPRREGDPPRLIADSSRAKSILGWTPSRPKLETILEDAWKWHRKRFGS